MSDQITTEIDGHVLRVKINRPEKKNALSAAMYLQIVDAFEQAAKTKTIRVLTLEGSEDVFSAGNDMDTFFD
ncbi:MAG: enoyl-CoA hydratase-related protein, partial [Parvularculaceae bacterium]